MLKLKNYTSEKEGIKEWDFLRHLLQLKKEELNKPLTSISKSHIAKCEVIRNGQKIDPPNYTQIFNFHNGITTENPSEGLILYLYKYLCNSDRESFWQNSKNRKTYDEWIGKKRTPQYEDSKTVSEAVFEQLKTEKQALERAFAAQRLWYMPPPIEEEVQLKELLTFVNDPNSPFLEKIKVLIQSLMRGYENLGNETVKLNPKLKWYKDETTDEPRQGVFYFKSKDGYDFGIDKVTWTGFDKEGQAIENVAHQLFSDFTNTILSFDAQKGGDFLNKLLDIESDDCTAIILYVGFVKDGITAMARYPAFSEDMRTIGKDFVMGSRPWWRDALNMERREKFSWTDQTIDNQLFTIGLSKPYQTIRADAPNERCLWIDVPVASPAKMIIGIDLLRM